MIDKNPREDCYGLLHNLLNILCEWTSFPRESPWALLNSLNSKVLGYILYIPKTVEHWQINKSLEYELTWTKRKVYKFCVKAPSLWNWPLFLIIYITIDGIAVALSSYLSSWPRPVNLVDNLVKTVNCQPDNKQMMFGKMFYTDLENFLLK